MKKLVAPGQVVIASSPPSTRQGVDSRGIRICFSELGRSCALMQGYLVFTDGSAYVYDAPSNESIEALCAQLQRGKVFNFRVRRSQFGFVRGFTPPPDYETIYSFPPYAGSAPVACSLPRVDWSTLFWTVTTNSFGAGSSCSFDPDPGSGDTASMDYTRVAFGLSGTGQMDSDLTYAGGSDMNNLHFEIDDPTNSIGWNAAYVVTVGGSDVLNTFSFGTGNFSQDYPFTVPDTGGSPTNIHVSFLWQPHSGGNVVDLIASVKLTNV